MHIFISGFTLQITVSCNYIRIWCSNRVVSCPICGRTFINTVKSLFRLAYCWWTEEFCYIHLIVTLIIKVTNMATKGAQKELCNMICYTGSRGFVPSFCHWSGKAVTGVSLVASHSLQLTFNSEKSQENVWDQGYVVLQSSQTGLAILKKYTWSVLISIVQSWLWENTFSDEWD